VVESVRADSLYTADYLSFFKRLKFVFHENVNATELVTSGCVLWCQGFWTFGFMWQSVMT